jgi:preprotein translocase subunit SecD
MQTGLTARVAFVIVTILLAIWILIPSFLPKEDQARLEAAALRAADPDVPEPETPDPWYIQYLPNTAINLGLDLQGGLELTLDVAAEEAVLSTVQRDLLPLKSAAEREGIKLLDARRERNKPVLKVAPDENVSLGQLQSLMQGQFRYYTYKTSIEENGKKYFIYEMTEEEQAAISDRAVSQALETIRNRIDATGVKEPSISRKGERGIDIQLPGETDVDQAVAAIGTTAQLEFILVDESANMNAVESGLKTAEVSMPAADFADDRVLSDWMVDNGHLPANRKLYWQYEEVKKGLKAARLAPYVLKDEIILTGDDINDAQTGLDQQTSSYYVALEFKPRGAGIFAEVTGANVKKRFAIVLDGKVMSAPVINERIPGGRASIRMGDDSTEAQFKEASTLALVLRSGALPAPVVVGEVRTVGAGLGEQAIQDGVMASLFGSIMVFFFAAFYYRTSGVLADISLLLNVLFCLACLAVAGATLTLPGICGIALTVGMAVDCNIIIFERIREELRAGRSVKMAIEAGFDRASVAVVDSNVTNLIAGIVLYSYGSGPIRGFAVTLMIGIFTTLFSGVFVSRILMDTVNQGRRNISI